MPLLLPLTTILLQPTGPFCLLQRSAPTFWEHKACYWNSPPQLIDFVRNWKEGVSPCDYKETISFLIHGGLRESLLPPPIQPLNIKSTIKWHVMGLNVVVKLEEWSEDGTWLLARLHHWRDKVWNGFHLDNEKQHHASRNHPILWLICWASSIWEHQRDKTSWSNITTTSTFSSSINVDSEFISASSSLLLSSSFSKSIPLIMVKKKEGSNKEETRGLLI